MLGNDLPMTIHKLVCANGETIEWSLRVHGEPVETLYTTEKINRAEAARRLIAKIVKVYD